MSWNIETFGKFMESKQSNPTEFNRLCQEDPTGRLWAAMRKAERDYLDAKNERQALGVTEISIMPERSAELENTMRDALDRRQKAITGLEQACGALGGHQEPSVRALQARAAFLRRTRKGGDAGPLDSLVAHLEQIARDAGV